MTWAAYLDHCLVCAPCRAADTPLGQCATGRALYERARAEARRPVDDGEEVARRIRAVCPPAEAYTDADNAAAVRRITERPVEGGR